MTDRYQQTLTSARWKKLKYRRAIECGFKCEKCGLLSEHKNPKKAIRIFHLQHAHYRTVGEEQIEDVRIYCPACHFGPGMHPWRD